MLEGLAATETLLEPLGGLVRATLVGLGRIGRSGAWIRCGFTGGLRYHAAQFSAPRTLF